jgi:hypothetical protein
MLVGGAAGAGSLQQRGTRDELHGEEQLAIVHVQIEHLGGYGGG